MSAVERARMLYYENSAYSFSNLKIFDPTQAIRTKSLESLEQITNLCQKIKLSPSSYQQSPLQLKKKYLQAYQFSYFYSNNLKKMCDHKQPEIIAMNSRLKEQIQTKRTAIKEHKKKVQKRKQDYRQIKIHQTKTVYKHFQTQMQALKNKQNQLHQIKQQLQQQITAGRNHLLQHQYPISQGNYQGNNNFAHQMRKYPNPNFHPENPLNPVHPHQNTHQINQPDWNFEDITKKVPQNINQKVVSNPKIPTTSKHTISNSIYDSKNQRHSQALIDEYNQEEQIQSLKSVPKKGTAKNMSQSKVSIKFMQTQIGDKEDLTLMQSLKQESKISKKTPKPLHSINEGLIINEDEPAQLSSPTSKVRITDQTFNDLDEENDIVYDLDDCDLAPESNRLTPSPINKSAINSQVSKGSNSFIDSADSFYNHKIAIDSNVTRNDLLNSNSGITPKSSQPLGNLFNQSNIKRKSGNYDTNNLQKSNQDYTPTHNHDSVRLTNNNQMADKNLWMSKNGVNANEEIVGNLFNAPKKKTSQNINLSYGSLNDQNFVASPRKSNNMNDDFDDLDDLQLGITTNESKIQKKGTKNQPKIPLKVTSSRLDEVAEQADSQITSKQTTKIIIPPEIPKEQDVSDYEDDFENDNQEQKKSQVKLQVDKTIQVDKTNKSEEGNNKSQIQINVSPNNSFTEILKDDKIFADLVQDKFQLNQERKLHSSIDKQKGLFVGYSDQTRYNNQEIGISQNNFAQSNDNDKDPVTVSDDFMDDFFIPEHSIIGKKPTGLKKTSKLTSQNDLNQSYKINVINNQNVVTLKESIHQSNNQNDEDDLLLQLGGDLLSTKVIKKHQNHKPQTMNLIESTTFNQNHHNPINQNHHNPKPSTQHKNITQFTQLLQLNNNPFLQSIQNNKDSRSQSIQNNKDSRSQSKKLLQLNNPVLQSRQNGTIAEQEVQEDINFELEEDNSRLMQSQKQQIQRKLVKIMRNKHKPTDKPNLNPKHIDQQIQNQIHINLLQNKPSSKEPDWKAIKATFQTKIKHLTKEQNGNSKNIETKLTAIDDRNKKLMEQQRQRQQKEKSKPQINQDNQDDEDSMSDLNYSQSLIKDSFMKSALNKKNLKLNQLLTDPQPHSITNKMTNSSLIGDDAMTLSLKEKSMIGIKNPSELPQIMQNNSFEADSIYNISNLNQTDQFMIPQLNEQSKFIKSKQAISKNNDNNVNRSNNLIGNRTDANENISKDDKRPNEVSKSKYVKTTTPTPKSIPKETTVSRLQQNKYVTLEDPLNNQISTNKSIPKKPVQDDQDDF